MPKQTFHQRLAEIDKLYGDHIESLELSGLEFDRDSIVLEHAAACDALRQEYTQN